MKRKTKARRPRDAGATREVLLDAATLVFAERGFAGARVDEIAARAGVNKALIYAYYDDKKGIYRAVLSSRLREFADPSFSEGFATDVGPRRALEDLVRRWLRMLVKDRPFSRLVAWDLLSNGREGQEILVETSVPFLNQVSALVKRAVDAGELEAGTDPELFRTSLVSIGIGYMLQHSAMAFARAQAGTHYTDEQFVDHVCRLLLAPREPPRQRRSA